MSIAWRAILVAGLAAGEEATLASLTGLFQREPERAAALVASAREGARAINQSRHSEGHETYFRQRRRIEAAVGDYKFYVHAGGAFDAITTDLFKGRPDHKKFYGLAEELAEVWVHRALLADKRRTTNPAEATLFFVPAYLTANKKRAGHDERLDGLVAALKRDPYFQKNGGRDHVFGYSSWNPGVAKGIGLWRISKLLKQGHFGVFEVNNAWIAANQPQAGRLDLKDRMIPMPYVVNAATFRGDHREVHTHEISVFLC